MKEVVPFNIAESPAKKRMLGLVDEVRGEIERGECVALLIVPIKTGAVFDVRSAGEIRKLELAGIFGSCWLSALEDMRKP